jgi:hypothetical protein
VCAVRDRQPYTCTRSNANTGQPRDRREKISKWVSHYRRVQSRTKNNGSVTFACVQKRRRGAKCSGVCKMSICARESNQISQGPIRRRRRRLDNTMHRESAQTAASREASPRRSHERNQPESQRAQRASAQRVLNSSNNGLFTS